MKKLMIALLCASLLFTGAASPASAATDDSKEIEAMSRWLDGLTLAPSSGASGAQPAGAADPGGVPTEEEQAAYARRVFELVNEERVKAGVDPVVWDDGFAACAQIRAGELPLRYSHTRPVEPEDPSVEWPMNTNGIGEYNAPSVADEQGIPHEWIMENIAAQNKTPEAVVEAWMNSAGHRRNILRESHTRCGVGYVRLNERNENGMYIFWTLWFDSYEE